jgi:hypothetical protein
LKTSVLLNVVTLGFGVELRFKGGVSGCEYDHRRLTLSPQTGHLSGVITRFLWFFKGRVFLSFQPDQSDGF